MHGTIRSLNRRKGQVGGKPTFGFIRAQDGEEFFFVPSSMQQMSIPFDELVEGLNVVFTPIDGDRPGKGRRAIEVMVTRESALERGPVAPPHAGGGR